MTPVIHTVREAVPALFEETPAVRMKQHGTSSLSDAEVVSLITGRSIEESRNLVRGGLFQLSQSDPRFAKSKAAVRLAAALELGRRVAAQAWSEPAVVKTADDIARGLIARHSHKVQEEVGAVYLNGRHAVIREVPAIYRGTLTSALVSCRDVLRIGLELNAAALILWHAHPSGDPSPSAEDMTYTRKLNEACKAVGLDLLDHLIIGTNRYVSMKDRGYF